MNTSHICSHSQEISVSFANSQQFYETAKLTTISSSVTQTTEDETPASRKRVIITKKQQSQEISIRKEVKIELGTSTDDSLWNTPSKKEVKGTAKTIKKGQTMQEMQYLPMTVNKNRHATKAFSQSEIVPRSDSQQEKKARKSPVFGKRKFEEYEEDEEEVEYKKEKNKNLMTPEFLEDNLKPLVNLDNKRVKLNEVEKPAGFIEYEEMYLWNQTTNEILHYHVFLDKDLGFDGSVQSNLKETEVDNDCATDTEVMEKVRNWTMDDLFEGIMKHKEENEDEEDKEVLKERIKRYLFGDYHHFNNDGYSSGSHSRSSRSSSRSHSSKSHSSSSHSSKSHSSRHSHSSESGSESEEDRDGMSTSEEYSSHYHEIKFVEGGNQKI